MTGRRACWSPIPHSARPPLQARIQTANAYHGHCRMVMAASPVRPPAWSGQTAAPRSSARRAHSPRRGRQRVLWAAITANAVPSTIPSCGRGRLPPAIIGWPHSGARCRAGRADEGPTQPSSGARCTWPLRPQLQTEGSSSHESHPRCAVARLFVVCRRENARGRGTDASFRLSARGSRICPDIFPGLSRPNGYISTLRRTAGHRGHASLRGFGLMDYACGR